MKLIIDISDNLYNAIKSDKYGLHKGKMYDIIRNGIPLDSVKTEINKAYDDVTMYSCDEQVSHFASIVCGILNRIDEAESEE